MNITGEATKTNRKANLNVTLYFFLKENREGNRKWRLHCSGQSLECKNIVELWSICLTGGGGRGRGRGDFRGGRGGGRGGGSRGRGSRGGGFRGANRGGGSFRSRPY